MASLLGNTSARRSSDSQRSLAGVPSSPSFSRSTCPANRLPKLLIILESLPLRSSPSISICASPQGAAGDLTTLSSIIDDSVVDFHERPSPRQPRVEGVADGVTDEVQAHHRDEERDARAEDDPWGLLEIAAAGVDHAAPRRLRG